MKSYPIVFEIFRAPYRVLFNLHPVQKNLRSRIFCWLQQNLKPWNREMIIYWITVISCCVGDWAVIVGHEKEEIIYLGQDGLINNWLLAALVCQCPLQRSGDWIKLMFLFLRIDESRETSEKLVSSGRWFGLVKSADAKDLPLGPEGPKTSCEI